MFWCVMMQPFVKNYSLCKQIFLTGVKVDKTVDSVTVVQLVETVAV